jgi:hypothetical protein
MQKRTNIALIKDNMDYKGIFVKTKWNGKVQVWNWSKGYIFQQENTIPVAKKNFLIQLDRLKKEYNK